MEKHEVIEKAVARLQELIRTGCDSESGHIVADGVLCQALEDAGMKEIVEAYELVEEEIGFWYA